MTSKAFTLAHQIAKAIRNDFNTYRAALASAMKGIYDLAKRTKKSLASAAAKILKNVKPSATKVESKSTKLNNIKHAILNWAQGFNHSQSNDVEDVLASVSFTKGFASKVADTVIQYRKASEKQAYVIARAAVELGIEF